MAIICGRQMGLDMPTLAKQFKTSKSVIWATSNTPNLSKATGRPLKISSRDDRIIVRMNKKNPRLTSTDINSELKDHYGVQLTWLPGVQGHCQKKSAPRFTLQKAPSEQANDSGEEPFSSTEVGKGSSALEWNKVLWSDESKYLMIDTDGVTLVRRPGLLPRKSRRLTHPNHRNHGELNVQGHLEEGNDTIWKISDGYWVVVPTGQRSETLFPFFQGLDRTASSERYDLAKPISRPESLRTSLGADVCDYNGCLWNNIGIGLMARNKPAAAHSALKKAAFINPLDYK
uniref:TPR_REGION domain-containing protein n=1 Tax=Caenorhabditis japonica TaxID=281687 RepID=A0A8R1IGA6_CAEJA